MHVLSVRFFFKRILRYKDNHCMRKIQLNLISFSHGSFGNNFVMHMIYFDCPSIGSLSLIVSHFSIPPQTSWFVMLHASVTQSSIACFSEGVANLQSKALHSNASGESCLQRSKVHCSF